MPGSPCPNRGSRLGPPAMVVAAVLAISAVPAPLHAQEPTPPQVGIERLTAYAKAHVAITAVREAFAAQLADARNKTPEAQVELRRAVRQRIALVLQEHGMTEAEHRRITYIVSVDADQRSTFERIRTEIEAGGKTGGGG
jgi:predicted metal-dependent hydrolase